jgi:tricorn protease
VRRAAEAKRRARFAAKSTAPLGDKGGEKGGPEKGGPEKGGEGSASAHPSPRPSARPFANPSANPDVGPDESASPKENAKKRVVSGIKNVVVTPLSHEECTQLKAADALNNRRGYVAKKSDDQLAYIYLEDMEQMGEGASNSFDDFAAQFYPAIRKAGLIIDVRRNAGGNIDTWILERLRRVAWMFNTQRSGPGDTTMQYAFRGKVAVLVDEMTSSDAEIFAAGVQQLGLGAVVGARTWGGAVGYSSNPELALVDGSGFTIPSFGPYVSGKWMIEQRGVVPDIAVANDPVATFNGKDAQLDAAVAHLMGLIEKEPKAAAIPAKPEYPDWSFDREVCRAGGDGGGRAREQRKGVLA